MGLALERQAELVGSGPCPLLRILGVAAHWFAAGVFGKDAFGLLAKTARAAHRPDLIAGRAGGTQVIDDGVRIGLAQHRSGVFSFPWLLQVVVGDGREFRHPAAGKCPGGVLVLALFDRILNARRVDAGGA